MFKFIKRAYTKHLDGLVEKYWQIYKFDMNPNHTSYNNEGDAFKHCMFQAELTFWFGERIAKFFGDLHENKPDNPEAERVMDLHNNSIGREIGLSFRKGAFKYLLGKGKIEKIYDGIAAVIMLRMEAGELITEV